MPARFVLGAILVLAAAACQPGAGVTQPLPPASPATTPAPSATPVRTVEAASPSPASIVPADAIVVTVSVTGGECANGPCGASYAIYGDGRVDGPASGTASIPPERAAAIASLAATTDWDAVRSVPFTGECPTAFDGQKHVYAFPADTGDLVFDSCEVDLSAVPVVQAIDAALFGG